MQFTESRGNDGSRPAQVGFSDALLAPTASFGGIYSPDALTPVDAAFLERHCASSYPQLALALMQHLDVDVDEDLMRRALALYDRFDDPQNPVPVVDIGRNRYVCELYHGPTRAFKDMALQPFGLILSELAQRRCQNYLILTATSGDTGPAALDTFRGRDPIRVVCLYPDGGTSDVQRLQMVTEAAPNLKVIGIRGNFDDAQSALKRLLSNQAFHQRLGGLGLSLSAANSVNFGRILFQIVYHFHAYLELRRRQVIAAGDGVAIHIPSGNFGNALGAYYARRLGLPVDRIVIASNANNVLTDWINSGAYDLAGRELIATTSPAMDILKSSNVERVLFDLFGAARTRKLMQGLDRDGHYQLDADEHERLHDIFAADYCSDEEGKEYIREAFADGYLMDPHTATCLKTCASPEFSTRVNLIHSTAEWTKFAPVIDNAINGNDATDDLTALRAVATRAGIGIPPAIEQLFERPIAHRGVVDADAVEDEIFRFLEA